MERVRDTGLVAQQQPVPTQSDDVRWLALLIRQGLKLIVAGIEARYGLDKKQEQRAA